MARHAAGGGQAVPHPLRDELLHRAADLVAMWDARQERQWLGLVAVPLAMTAAGLTGAWWLWPLLMLLAWTCLRSWRWLWLIALELGVVGWQWAALGTMALAGRVASFGLAVLAWVAFPLLLAVSGMVSRRLHHRAMTQFPH